MRRQIRVQTGFTLIELLVVVAVIAILAAILFPVFAQAREKARQAACTSNVRQLGLTMTLYANDWDENYPPFTHEPPNTYNGWFWLIRPYAGEGGIPSGRPSRSDFPDYWKGLKLGICPSAPLTVLAYGMSEQLNDWRFFVPGKRGPEGVSLAAISRPSEVVALAETIQWTSKSGDFTFASFDGTPECWGGRTGNGSANASLDADAIAPRAVGCMLPRHRHNHGTMVAWADGHASWRRKGSLIWCRHINIGDPGPDCPP